MPFASRRVSFDVHILRLTDPYLWDQETYQGTVARDATVRQIMVQLLRNRNHHYRLENIDFLLTRARRWRYVAIPRHGPGTKIRSTKKIINLRTFRFALEIML